MKKQIVRVSMLQTAKVVAGLYLLLSLPALLVGAIALLLVGMPGWILAVALVPIAQMVLGFLTALLGGWLYNLVAARVGGFEFVTTDIHSSQA